MNPKQCIPVFFLIFIFLFSACGSTPKESLPDAPFTSLTWENNIDDMISAEGDSFSTYDSVYGGLCYTYPKKYEDREGTVKYMFDDQDRLMCVAWTCSCEDESELFALYQSITDSVNERHGESGYQADHPGNYGNVWYLESGDIVLSTMVTSELKALQYAYLHPLVSGQSEK